MFNEKIVSFVFVVLAVTIVAKLCGTDHFKESYFASFMAGLMLGMPIWIHIAFYMVLTGRWTI